MKKQRKILYYDVFGNLLGSYDSIEEAANALGVSPGAIKSRIQKKPEEWLVSYEDDEILDVVMMVNGSYFKLTDGRTVLCDDTYLDENDKIRLRRKK